MAATTTVSCGDDVNNKRIPAYPVFINLSTPGLWSTYGVGGVMQYREFIKEENIPSDFGWLGSTFTGYGGVLLCGVDAASNFADDTWPYLPVAYDLSCPVEMQQNVRVYVNDRFEAVCPKCGSHYTLMSGGGPVSGPAVAMRYGLQPYKCVGSPMTGFTIVRK